MGTILDFEDLTKETVQNAIKFALDKSTQENANKVSYSFKNRAQRPVETAIWWVEHVAATSGVPLTKSNSTFMSWYEYHLIDVYVVVAGVVIISVSFGILFVKSVGGMLSTKATKTKKLS